jgi:hypothetical protein
MSSVIPGQCKLSGEGRVGLGSGREPFPKAVQLAMNDHNDLKPCISGTNTIVPELSFKLNAYIFLVEMSL